MYKSVKRKSSNRDRILECIFRNTPVSRTRISELTGITPATTTLTISELISEGIVLELDQDDCDLRNNTGRKRIPLDICPDYRLALGIELNQRALYLCITDLKGKIHYQYYEPYTQKLSERITDAIIEQIHATLKTCGLKETQLVGIGLAIPGHMDVTSTNLVSNNKVWQGFDAARIRAAFSIPVFIENNGRCMALSRYLFQPAVTPDSFALFHVGLGMFCANMMNGQLFLGNAYVSGEIGHTIVNPNGHRCECGKQGCLQTIASERWLLENARRLYSLNSHCILKSLAPSADELTIDTIATAYALGDEAVCSFISNALRYLGIATSNIAILMNPERIFLHGKLFTYPDIHNELMNIIENQLSFVDNQHVDSIEILPYLETDGAVGGAALAILEGFLGVVYT